MTRIWALFHTEKWHVCCVCTMGKISSTLFYPENKTEGKRQIEESENQRHLRGVKSLTLTFSEFQAWICILLLMHISSTFVLLASHEIYIHNRSNHYSPRIHILSLRYLALYRTLALRLHVKLYKHGVATYVKLAIKVPKCSPILSHLVSMMPVKAEC